MTMYIFYFYIEDFASLTDLCIKILKVLQDVQKPLKLAPI